MCRLSTFLRPTKVALCSFFVPWPCARFALARFAGASTPSWGHSGVALSDAITLRESVDWVEPYGSSSMGYPVGWVEPYGSSSMGLGQWSLCERFASCTPPCSKYGSVHVAKHGSFCLRPRAHWEASRTPHLSSKPWENSATEEAVSRRAPEMLEVDPGLG